MTKKSFIFSTLFIIAALLPGSCGGKKKLPKTLKIPVEHAVIDTIARLSDQMQCHIQVNFTYLKGKQYAQANDSLLKMGLLQPDYFSILSHRIDPKVAIREFVKRYAKEYLDMARLLRIKEKAAAKTIGSLAINTFLSAGKGDYVVATSHIEVNSGNGDLTKYDIIRNFDPKTGRVITLKDEFGDDYKEKVTPALTKAFADYLNLEDDDIKGIQRLGYFEGIDIYPAANYTLGDDYTTFYYNAGEISTKQVKISIEN